MTRYTQTASIVTGIAFALQLWAASAQAPTFEHPVTLPANCAISAQYEDGSRTAECPDGTHYVFDADGQRYVNDAGVPLRAPGWYPVQ